MIRKLDITTFDFPQGAVIWDVRDEKSFQEGHIQGAINHPIASLGQAQLDSVPADQTIYVLCGGGSKAPRAAEMLHHLDANREVVVLMGGTRAAKAAGLTIVSGA